MYNNYYNDIIFPLLNIKLLKVVGSFLVLAVGKSIAM